MGRSKERGGLTEQERNELFRQYVEPHLKLVYNTVSSYTINPSDVEDNYQESLLNLLNYIHTYDPERSVQTWIITCTIRFVGKLEAARGLRPGNANREEFRKSYIERYAPKGRLKPAYIEEVASAMHIRDESLDYSDTRLSDEVERAVLSIKPAYARAFLFRHMVGMSLEEIAELEGINKNMAKHRVHMAKSLLQEKLGEYAATRT